MHKVANIILEQLGGNKFLVMTGAKNLVSSDYSLFFSIPLTKKINRVQITLNPDDVYEMTFLKYNSKTLMLEEIHKISGLHADMLAPVFELKTGLATKL